MIRRLGAKPAVVNSSTSFESRAFSPTKPQPHAHDSSPMHFKKTSQHHKGTSNHIKSQKHLRARTPAFPRRVLSQDRKSRHRFRPNLGGGPQDTRGVKEKKETKHPIPRRRFPSSPGHARSRFRPFRPPAMRFHACPACPARRPCSAVHAMQRRGVKKKTPKKKRKQGTRMSPGRPGENGVSRRHSNMYEKRGNTTSPALFRLVQSLLWSWQREKPI